MLDIDFNEFLRLMTFILIVLLSMQGLDYIVGFGVNNYLFILFCIVFAFTIGGIYHHIITGTDNKEENEYVEHLDGKLNNLQDDINKEFDRNGLTDSVLESQVKLNSLRCELDLKDTSQVLGEDGFVQ